MKIIVLKPVDVGNEVIWQYYQELYIKFLVVPTYSLITCKFLRMYYLTTVRCDTICKRDVAQWFVCRSLQFAAACRASSRLAGCRIFREISCFPRLNAGTLFYQSCVAGQVTLRSSASLHSGVNEYLVEMTILLCWEHSRVTHVHTHRRLRQGTSLSPYFSDRDYGPLRSTRADTRASVMTSRAWNYILPSFV